MSLTRRQFLLSVPAVAAGFILPSFLVRATGYLEKSGELLLEPPEQYTSTLTAHDYGSGEFVLSFGHPYAEPPKLTLREYMELYFYGDAEEYQYDHGLDAEEFEAALDESIDEEIYFDSWILSDSPQRIAYDYLSCLDLGLDLEGDEAVGAIDFINGPCPGNDYTAVHAPDMLSLSLLQERLNQLGEGVKIEIYNE